MLRFNKDLPGPKRLSKLILAFFCTKLPYVVILCIFIARFFATAGLITKSRLAFAIEETLWRVGFFTILPLALIQRRRIFGLRGGTASAGLGMLTSFAIVNITWCVIYCT